MGKAAFLLIFLPLALSYNPFDRCGAGMYYCANPYSLDPCCYCSSQCFTCMGGPSSCTECRTGYMNNPPTCTPCDTGCATCSTSFNYCTSCLENYTLNANTNKCVFSCTGSSYPNPSQAQTCSTCHIANCRKCAGEFQCESCENGFGVGDVYFSPCLDGKGNYPIGDKQNFINGTSERLLAGEVNCSVGVVGKGCQTGFYSQGNMLKAGYFAIFLIWGIWCLVF